jgi:TrmH family RNA methyltransferase
VIGIYRQRFSEPGGALSVYLHGVGDPGNVGTLIRAVHALADGPVVLGPGCADPYSPKAVRASMGSVFARPPARAGFMSLDGGKLALDASADAVLAGVNPSPPLVVCAGAERDGLPAEVLDAADHRARVPIRVGGPESLNVAMAVTVALYELGNRMARYA